MSLRLPRGRLPRGRLRSHRVLYLRVDPLNVSVLSIARLKPISQTVWRRNSTKASDKPLFYTISTLCSFCSTYPTDENQLTTGRNHGLGKSNRRYIEPDVISTALVATALVAPSKIETPSPENRDLLLIYEHLLAVESMCSLQSMTWPVAQNYIGVKANNLMKEEIYIDLPWLMSLFLNDCLQAMNSVN